MSLQDLKDLTHKLENTHPMPVLFIGHGSPMNAIEDNEFSRGWRQIAAALSTPAAILCISAHWETRGTLVTAMEHPRTIHDFGGFPRPLYEAQYPAPGSPWLAQETRTTLQPTPIGLDQTWGLDHGCWSVLAQMFPAADIPVIQMSLDNTKSGLGHYDLARQLQPLRRKGVLIIASGNIVHNLRRIVLRGNDFNEAFALDWAAEADQIFKKLINAGDHHQLANYQSLGPAVQLAVPTPEHYLPLLYALALQQENETITYFNDKPVAGSLTMTSLKIN